MKITYDPEVDALYICLAEGKIECETLHLNDQVALDIGPKEQLVGIEILDASTLIPSLASKKKQVTLENLTPA